MPQKREPNDLLAGAPVFMFTREVADFLRCQPRIVNELVVQGELRAIQRERKKGSPILVYTQSVREYLERKAR